MARRCALAPRPAAVLEGGYNVETSGPRGGALEGFGGELGRARGLEPFERLAA